LDYMVSAGYNPYGMVETMQILQREEKSRPVEFLSTHPSPENRIGYITEKIQNKYLNLASLKIGAENYQVNVLSRLKK
jgi:predicted Zn-dependent protease